MKTLKGENVSINQIITTRFIIKSSNFALNRQNCISLQYIMLQSGKILTATPFSDDENFKRTVVLLAECNKLGALGFILNRPTAFMLNELLDEIYFRAPIFLGGPVSTETIYYLHTLGNKLPGSVEIIKGLYWGGNFDALKTMLNNQMANPADVKFFAGYSGWSEGQLEMECLDKAWVIGDTNAREAMSLHLNEDFWRKKMRDDKEYQIWSNMTDLPYLN